MADDKKGEIVKRDIKKELRKLETTEAKWTKPPTVFDHLPPHERPFNIEPFPDERQRLPFKMSDEDRLKRKKWVQAQTLTDREPVRVPQLEKMIFNPIRRLYRAPLDKLFKALEPTLGFEKARYYRWLTPKVFFVYFGALTAWYHLKYYQRTWEGRYGWSWSFSNPAVLPGQPAPPALKNEDYSDNGFKSRKVFRGPDYAY